MGVKNGLDYPEKDVDDITGALEKHGASWDSADMTKLKGGAATPQGIQNAINAAKADSKPGTSSSSTSPAMAAATTKTTASLAAA